MERADTDWTWVSQAKAVVGEVRSLCDQRQGRLVALTVQAPRRIPEDELRELLLRELRAQGIEDLDLSITANGAPLRIQTAEFEA